MEQLGQEILDWDLRALLNFSGVDQITFFFINALEELWALAFLFLCLCYLSYKSKLTAF